MVALYMNIGDRNILQLLGKVDQNIVYLAPPFLKVEKVEKN